ncbi:hypothetical protein GS421_02325 [Rhodococcus hoagii]|nr:hypothetical protein [Prescottella equi]
MQQMVPSLGLKLSDNPDLFQQVWDWSTRSLELGDVPHRRLRTPLRWSNPPPSDTSHPPRPGVPTPGRGGVLSGRRPRHGRVQQQRNVCGEVL